MTPATFLDQEALTELHGPRGGVTFLQSLVREARRVRSRMLLPKDGVSLSLAQSHGTDSWRPWGPHMSPSPRRRHLRKI